MEKLLSKILTVTLGGVAVLGAMPSLQAVGSSPGEAAAQLPESYLKRWDDPAVQQRIDEGIEQNRKSTVELKVVDADGQPVSGAQVKVVQRSHEFLFGCNIFMLGQMGEKEEAYQKAFLDLFNSATVALYWGDLEPEDGKLRFAEGSEEIWRRPPPDRVVGFGQEHGLTLKGHPLLWHNARHNPQWIPADPDVLKARYIRRWSEIAGRYAADIPMWDGVNESMICPPNFPLLAADHRPHRPYVAWAFNELRKLFRPDNHIMINEVTRFNWPPTAENRYYQQLKTLLGDGVGIDGIGFQFHYFSRRALDDFLASDHCDPAILLDTYKMFAEFDLPIWITEVTFGSAGEGGNALQARVARDFYRLWFSSPKIAGITWWNLADGTAYRNEQGAIGGLVDEDCQPKPSYEALHELIKQDWTTELETTSDADGLVVFRGFHGGYKVEVTAAGQTREFEVTVSSGKSTEARLTLL